MQLQHIRHNLFTFGDLMGHLHQGSTHLPSRNSKLTSLLQLAVSMPLYAIPSCWFGCLVLLEGSGDVSLLDLIEKAVQGLHLWFRLWWWWWLWLRHVPDVPRALRAPCGAAA